MGLNYFYGSKKKKSNKLVLKYYKEGYITEEEFFKYGKENEAILIGIGKTRKLSQRMQERLKISF